MAMPAWMSTCWAAMQTFRHEAALAFGSDYDLERDDALWPRPGMALQS